jgi:hypothetical protein
VDTTRTRRATSSRAPARRRPRPDASSATSRGNVMRRRRPVSSRSRSRPRGVHRPAASSLHGRKQRQIEPRPMGETAPRDDSAARCCVVPPGHPRRRLSTGQAQEISWFACTCRSARRSAGIPTHPGRLGTGAHAPNRKRMNPTPLRTLPDAVHETGADPDPVPRDTEYRRAW